MMPRSNMLRVGTCTVCGTGNVGIRAAASGGLVAMCDECDAVWLDRGLTDGPHFPEQPDLPSPRDRTSLRTSTAHWATRAEALAGGWADSVLEETETIG